MDVTQCLSQAISRIHQLKLSLTTVDTQVRVLKLEAVHEELLLLQRDLSRRSAALERLTVLPGSPVVGLKLGDLELPASVRLVTIFRGPFFINPSDNLLLRPDDVLLVIGLQTDLVELGTHLAPATQGAAV
jgi:Trk K+ transport system NAD-binding subunit